MKTSDIERGAAVASDIVNDSSDTSAWKMFYQRPKQVWLRRVAFQLHLWVGIGVGLWVCLMSLTGAMLVFREEISALINPRLYATQTTGSRAQIANVIQTIRTAYPGFS